MLNKIGMLTWIEAMLLTVLVGHYVPSVNAVLTSLKLPIKVFELEVSVLYVVPGTVIALLARIFLLHNGLAHAFHIRERFDVSKTERWKSNHSLRLSDLGFPDSKSPKRGV